MELTQQVNSHHRTQGNEVKKGYFPTFPSDIRTVNKVLDAEYGWKGRSAEMKTLTVFDPCAGEGEFLGAVTRHFKSSHNADNNPPCDIQSHAIELDADRFGKIKFTSQKVNSSFFDVEAVGKYNVILLNPPYNKFAGELLRWVKYAAPMLAYSGVMVLIIPEYELVKPEILDYLNNTFKFSYAFLSEEYERFKQVVIFLNKTDDNTSEPASKYTYRYCTWPDSNLTGEKQKYSLVSKGNKNLVLNVRASGSDNRPLLSSRDLSGLYSECEERLRKTSRQRMDKVYPSTYDATIQPLSNLRTAHAVQLAAMNSQIESVTINGDFYLAKYMLYQSTESYTDPDSKSTTTVYKPTVEVFLMDGEGSVKKAKEYGFDYVELNSELSTILLRKLTKMYRPLHDIGQPGDEKLDADLKEIGLLPPQREVVKATVKAFNAGRKGVGVRANTGTGKTWIAKAVKYITGAKRTVMVTEPVLIPQMVKEYENEGFDVHVIDSWEKVKELARLRPKGLYLIPYSRLRMHPKYKITVRKKKVIVNNNGNRSVDYVDACPSCNSALYEKLRSGEKPKCPMCREPLYTYLPENERPVMTFGKWIRDIEEKGTSTPVVSHNKQLPYIRYLKRIPFNLGIFDELHNAANLMSNQGTAFIRLASSCTKVLGLTATVTNGMAKSFFNILWGLNPKQMAADGWSRSTATDFQAKYGAFKEVRKSDENNRHRNSEGVKTYDTAGISPAALVYTLANFVNMDADDFDDLPPVEREVIRCAPHPMVEECIRTIGNIIDNADLLPEDKLAASSVENAAVLRVSDTFCHHSDELWLRHELHLGTLQRVQVDGLLEKEEKLVGHLQEALSKGERSLVYTGITQKLDQRPVLKGVITRNVPGATVEILPDSIAPDKIVGWFEKVTADIVIASFHRVATGLNLSQFNNLHWFDYTTNTRLAEQGDGRIRRVNTAMIHRKMFGEVRPCRYFYYTSSQAQEFQLSYTLEKRMIAKLAEGEIPDIDPAECSSGDQSFSALMTKALKEGTFEYNDPSVLLKKMTQSENARIRKANLSPSGEALAEAPDTVEEETVDNVEPKATVIPFNPPKPANAVALTDCTVIFIEDGQEMNKVISLCEYEEFRLAGHLDFQLWGTYVIQARPKKKKAA